VRWALDTDPRDAAEPSGRAVPPVADPDHAPQRWITDDRRRLRRHGWIERHPEGHRYGVAAAGLRPAPAAPWVGTVRPGLGTVMPESSGSNG
jgi:hypothetical protein